MSEDLFQPSLKHGEYEETKSYNISRIFYIAFFGGVIPTVALGTKNAKWLKVDNKIIALMMALGGLILFSKIIVAGLYTAKVLAVSSSVIKWSYRGATLLLYMGYYFLMRQKFQQHVVLGGKIEPILKDTVIWIIVAIAVEAVLLVLGGYVIRNVL